jgi:hypothetical protein
MSHIGHKCNDVQADGEVALRVDLFESKKKAKNNKINEKNKIIKHYILHLKCMSSLGLANFQCHKHIYYLLMLSLKSPCL